MIRTRRRQSGSWLLGRQPCLLCKRRREPRDLPSRPARTERPSPPPAERLRAEFSEIVGIAAQAARLGVAVDAADAIAKGVSPDALRRAVLEELAARAEATSVIAAAPPAAAASDSPIVRRAKERAAAAARP